MAKAKSSKKGKIIVITLIVLVALGLVGKFLIYDKLEAKMIDKVSENVVEQMLSGSGLADNAEVQRILESVTEEDKEKVTDIVSEQFGVADAPKVLEYVQDNDIEALKQYAKEKLTDEQISRLYEIYGKYK